MKLKRFLSVSLALAVMISSAFMPNIQSNAAESKDSTKAGSLNYILVNSPSINMGDTQTIVASVGKDGSKIDSATLSYRRDSDKKDFSVKAKKKVKNTLMFQITHKEATSDTYSVRKIEYKIDGKKYSVDLNKVNAKAKYGVNTDITTKPDYYIEEVGDSQANSSIEIISLYGASSNSTSSTKYVDSVNEALKVAEIANVYKKSGRITIALDAGHGGSDTGAVRGSLVERDINGKIVEYCQNELKKYSGVKIITTPRANDGNTVTGRDVRCEYAKSNGADVIISFHINAGGGTGAEVWVPKAGIKISESENLAQKILSELNALGLANRGTKDGTTKELGMVKYPAAYGIPGILIEHAFIDNANDTGHLSSDANLKKLGVADAKGIVKYFGLKKGDYEGDDEDEEYDDIDLYDNKDVKVSVKLNSSQTKATVKVSNIPGMKTADLKTVRLKMWSTEDGKDDVNWYKAKKKSSYCTYTVPIKDFKSTGKYKVEVYTQYGSNKEKKLISKSFTVADPSATVKISKKNDVAGTFRVDISKAKSGGGVKKVIVDVWRDSKSTKKTYTPKKRDDGSYRVSVDAANFGCKAGKYSVRVYIQNGVGQKVKVYSKSVKMVEPTAKVSASISKDFYINVTANNVFGLGGKSLERVEFKVWNNDLGKSNTIKIKGKLSEDTYKGKTDIAKFDFATGKYKVYVYGIYTNGESKKLGSSSVKVSSNMMLIMGDSVTSTKQLVRYYKSKASYPAYYAGTDAPDLETFCQMYIDECKAEGVRAEVAFAQAMKETGFMTYTGRVPIEANNFAGMGAIDSDVTAWAVYPDVRTGIRAQIQHLKAYASKEPLKKACVDGRFGLVTRGTAIYVEWLGIGENPLGKGWATAYRYGYSVIDDYIKPLLKS